MNRFAVLLRGVNVGGNMTVSMPALKLLLVNAGYTYVETHLNSGNVVLETEKDKAATEASIQQLIAQHFGLAIAVFVLSEEDLSYIVQHNPFDAETEADHSKRMVVVFREPIASDAETTLIKDEKEDANYYLRGKVAYIYIIRWEPDGRRSRTLL